MYFLHQECPLILEEALNATYKLSLLVAIRGWENAEVLQLFFIVFLRYVGVSPIVSSTVVCQPDFRDSLCLILGSCVTAQCCNSTYQPNKVLYYFSLVCLVFHKCFYVIGR